jgi:hypothetical protein
MKIAQMATDGNFDEESLVEELQEIISIYKSLASAQDLKNYAFAIFLPDTRINQMVYFMSALRSMTFAKPTVCDDFIALITEEIGLSSDMDLKEFAKRSSKEAHGKLNHIKVLSYIKGDITYDEFISFGFFDFMDLAEVNYHYYSCFRDYLLLLYKVEMTWASYLDVAKLEYSQEDRYGDLKMGRAEYEERTWKGHKIPAFLPDLRFHQGLTFSSFLDSIIDGKHTDQEFKGFLTQVSSRLRETGLELLFCDLEYKINIHKQLNNPEEQEIEDRAQDLRNREKPVPYLNYPDYKLKHRIEILEAETDKLRKETGLVMGRKRYNMDLLFPEIEAKLNRIIVFREMIRERLIVIYGNLGFLTIHVEPDASTPPKVAKKAPYENQKLSLRKIALKFVYKGLVITRINAPEIAKQYGHSSGDKLYQHFTYYTSRTNRINSETTDRKNKEKQILFEDVIRSLEGDQQAIKQAKDELTTFLKASGLD